MNTISNSLLTRRPLGNSGLSLSIAGLGGFKFGRNQAIKYPNTYALPDDKTIRNLLELAHELGINWIDTAPAYGNSESRLGTLIADRHSWIIASKVGETFHNGHSHFNFTATHIQASILQSMKYLRTDYLDIVTIHSDGNDLEIIQKSDCLETLQREKQAGKIRAIGMSCKTVTGAMAAMSHVDTLMLTLNPDARDDIPAIRAAQANNVGVIIKKGFGSGHLLNHYSLEELCRFLFSEPITSVIISTLNPRHLKDNIQALKDVSTPSAI